MCYFIEKRATRVKMIIVQDIPEKNMTFPPLAEGQLLAGLVCGLFKTYNRY